MVRSKGSSRVVHTRIAGLSEYGAITKPRWVTGEFAKNADRWVPPLLLVSALLLRLAFSWRFPLLPDEAETLLAAHGVAGHGVPIFPSGVLYLHGATLSYLLAPLVWLGRGELDDLYLLRAVSAVLGAITVYLTYRLAAAVIGSTAPALLAAALVAFHSLSVEWGGLLRMYALEQALAVVVAWLFVRQVVSEAGPAAYDAQRRELAGLVVTYWLAVFAQVGAALLWPGMAAAAVLLHGRSLLGSRRALSVALAACLPAPLVLIAASTVWGATGTAATSAAGVPSATFVGEQHVGLNLYEVLTPDLGLWTRLYEGGILAGVMPYLVAGLSGLLVGRYLLAGASDGERTRQSIAAMLLLYWVPVLAFAAVAVYAFPRALLFLQPLGAVLVTAALWAVAGRRGRAPWSEHPPPWQGAAVVGLAALLLLTDLGTGLRALGLHTRDRPDPIPAYRYVAAHHVPGEPIVVDWPPFAYFVLGDHPDLRFMVGAEWRFGRYTRSAGDDRLTDMFIGTEAVASVADLCELLAAHPGSWLVPDVLGEGAWPEAWKLVQGAAAEVFPPTEGMSLPVFRSVAPPAWTPEARQRCQSPGASAEDPAQGGNARRWDREDRQEEPGEPWLAGLLTRRRHESPQQVALAPAGSLARAARNTSSSTYLNRELVAALRERRR